MSPEQIFIVILAAFCAVLLIAVIALGVKYSRIRRGHGSADVVDGVRYSKKEDDSPVTHQVGDIVLSQGKTYTAGKNADLLPGNYTVLAASQSSMRFKLRIGKYVRDFSHGDTVVLGESQTVCAVSCNVILR